MNVSEAPILYFDGQCNLCNGTVQFILRNERSTSIKFATLQSGPGKIMKAKLALEAGDIDSLIFEAKGNIYIKSDAALEIAHQLKMPWRMAVGLKVLPRSLRDFGYDLIAKHRYKLFGRRDRCHLVDDYKERFIH